MTRTFRRGDVVSDPFGRLYLVLCTTGGSRLKMQLWNGERFVPKAYHLPSRWMTRAAEHLPAVQAIRAWEAERQSMVQSLVQRALSRVGAP